jgi:mannan endo-1,6-alpha-mannosidase
LIIGNTSFVNLARQGLAAASFNQTGNFLGSNEAIAVTLQGKWNDDILWYALATSSLASITTKYLPNPGGLSNYQISLNTYNQVQQQYDDVCGGGIYWSRNRNDPTRGAYKSAITNCQQILLGAQLELLNPSPNSKFITQSATTLEWMKSSGVLNTEYQVFDGLKTDKSCVVSQMLFSYPSGILSAGLANLYAATNNSQYLDDAHALYRKASTTFVTDGIVADKCESEDVKCKADQVSPKGVTIRGW